MTKAIVDIATPLGISVHDHIIVGKNGHAAQFVFHRSIPVAKSGMVISVAGSHQTHAEHYTGEHDGSHQ